MVWYSKTHTLLIPVHNDLDYADNTHNADDADIYNRAIGISKHEQKIANTHPKNIPNHTQTHTHTQTSELDNYNELSIWLSLKCSYMDDFHNGKTSNHLFPTGSLSFQPSQQIRSGKDVPVRMDTMKHVWAN